MENPVEEILSRLGGVTKENGEYMAFCPHHDDGAKHGRPSLSVKEGNQGQAMLHCFAGCPTEEIVTEIGLEWRDLWPPTGNEPVKHEWGIKDRDGNLVAVHHRLDLPNGDKRPWWTSGGKDGKLENRLPADLPSPKAANLPLYGIERLSSEGVVVLAEGEKATDALLDSGYNAVGTVTGASTTPTEDILADLRGRTVVLWPDNDEEGRAHMRNVAERLFKSAAEVRWYEPKGLVPKSDAADVEGLSEIKERVLNSKVYQPKAEKIEGPVSFGTYASKLGRILDARINGNGITGIPTGIRKVDAGLGGVNDGISYGIAARTNQGKSLFSLQIGIHAALEVAKRVLYISTEQSPWLYLDRAAHRVAGVSHKRSREGRITDAERQEVMDAAREIAEAPLVIAHGAYTINQIEEMCHQYDPELLIVDHIQRVKADEPRMPRSEQMGQISRGLTAVMSQGDIPLIFTAQINRGPESRTNKRPQISDIHWSGEIEQDANALMILYNPYRAGEKDAVPGHVEIHCDKFREGEPWQTTVQFEPEQNWLIDLDEYRAPSNSTERMDF